MKTAIRTPIVEAIRSVIQGGGGGPVSPVPLFYWKGQFSLAATTGTDPTFTRATAATFEDFEGVIRTVESSEPRFQGARRVENLVTVSEDFTASSWNKLSAGTGTIPVLTSGLTDPDGGSTAYRLQLNNGGGTGAADYSILRTETKDYTSRGAGHVIAKSIWVKSNTGVSQVVSLVFNSVAAWDITVTNSWQRVSLSSLAAGTVGKRYFEIATAGNVPSQTDSVDILIWRSQEEDVTGQTNQNPSEYVSTGVASATAPNLVTNGDFATDTSGWTAQAGLSSMVRDTSIFPDGGMKIVAAGGSSSYATQVITGLTVGNTYYISTSAYSPTGQGVNRATIGSQSAGFSPVGSKAQEVTGAVSSIGVAVVAASPSFTVYASIVSEDFMSWGTAGAFVYFDNISVKQVEHGANVDGVQYFNTLNANTVTSNVVTEAVGSPLTRANTQFGELNGVGGDYFSTPNVVTTWGELDIRARATVDSIQSSHAFLADKASSFFLAIRPVGATQRLAFRIGWGPDRLSIAFPTSVLGVRNWYRVTYDPSTGDANFFTADGNLEAPAISDYVQLGTTQNSGATAIPVNTTAFSAGTFGYSPAPYPFDGDIYRSQVFNEIDGTTPVVDFTAGSYVSGSTLVSSTSGETWTLVGNATIFQPPVDASGPFGYLAEKASTNLALQSEDFTTSWTTNAATVVANAAVAPDGTTTMDRLAVTTASGVHGVYQNQSLAAGTNYTASVYMKNDGAGFGGICIGSGNDLSVVVDLSTGLVTDTHTTGTGVLVAYGCDDVGNGIYRVWVSGNSSAPNYIIPFSSDAAVPSLWENGRPRYTGVAGEDILIWGAQLETSTYSTSYIPTTTTAVTRNADVLIAGDMVTDAAGSGYAEASSIWANSPALAYLISRNSTGRLLYAGAEPATFIKAYDGTNVPESPTDISFQGRPAPMASTWGNNFTVYKDGVGGAAYAYDGTMGTGNLGIGNVNGGSGQWNGTIREVKIFNSELTAAEVGDL